MPELIRKSSVHVLMVVVGLFVYVIAMGSSLLRGQHVCDEITVVLYLVSIAIICLAALVAFIVALAKRSKKTGVQGAGILFLAFVLHFIFYLLATQCPGW